MKCWITVLQTMLHPPPILTSVDIVVKDSEAHSLSTSTPVYKKKCPWHSGVIIMQNLKVANSMRLTVGNR
jgi:hypothetical protein